MSAIVVSDRLVQLVNDLTDAVERYDDAMVPDDPNFVRSVQAADALRDSANELRWFVMQKMVEV